MRLGAIQSFIFENNPLEAGSYLSKFADLIRSILYSSREEFISLEEEIKILENYLAIQQLRYENKFDFHFDIDPGIDMEATAVPPMLAQPFIENSIEHGLKSKTEKGQIEIKIKHRGDHLLFIVEDNGIGIEASAGQKAKEHKSLAMTITKERLQLLNKSGMNYSMSVERIEDKNGNVLGTRVRYFIPFGVMS